MTFKDWTNDYNLKKKNLLNKLHERKLSNEEITKYFKWNNMAENEPDYCELYKTNSKCHDYNELNCFFCACPHFTFSDNAIKIKNRKLRYSKCNINSRFRKDFEFKKNERINVQCDCSGCFLPHKDSYVLKALDKEVSDYLKNTNDGYSILEHIRSWQLTDILGKFKLF